MHLLLIGISHKTAPVELRERLDFHTRGLDVALRELGPRLASSETVVLSTCNRAELYAAADQIDQARTELVKFIADFHGVDRAALTAHLYELSDGDAVRHLFRVASGLDSLVVGEPQILGQVKEAYTAAADVRAVGPVLNRLFHSSFGVGKRVRTETALGSGAVSVSFAAMSLARKIFGDLKGRSVVVVGAGEMGKLTAMHMKSQGVTHVTIVSRTMAHAARTAEAIGGARAAPWDDLDGALAGSDIVISATGAAAPILTKARIEGIMRPRRGRALFIIDIAMPRDVEPAAGEIEQVFLYNIDDLQAVVAENVARRSSEIAHAARSTANGTTGPANEPIRSSSVARTGPCKSQTLLRVPCVPASATTCIMGPKAAAEMYGKADAITPRRNETTTRPRTALNMPRLRHTRARDIVWR